MKFRPLSDRVVIRRLASAGATTGGGVTPDTARERPQHGAVVAVGPGIRNESGWLTHVDLKPGEHVLFGAASGFAVTINAEELLVLKISEIIGVIEDDAAGDAEAV